MFSVLEFTVYGGDLWFPILLASLYMNFSEGERLQLLSCIFERDLPHLCVPSASLRAMLSEKQKSWSFQFHPIFGVLRFLRKLPQPPDRPSQNNKFPKIASVYNFFFSLIVF